MLTRMDLGVLTTAAFAMAASPALAQSGGRIRDIEPTYRVVMTDDTPVRCADLERYYAVTELDEGAVVVVDGESQAWARVRYPAEVPAIVPAKEAGPAGRGFIELVELSRLRAPSRSFGIAGSWRSLYEQELEPGTRLEVVEELRAEDGGLAGWSVVPPRPPAIRQWPYAYIRIGALRPATSDEIERFQIASEGVKPVPHRDEQPSGQGATAPTTGVADAEPAGSTPAATPDVAAGSTSVQGAGPDVASSAGQDAGQDVGPDLGHDAAQPAAVPLVPQAASWEALDATFEAARRLPRVELDDALEELLAEHKRAQATFEDEAYRQAIGARIDWIEIRQMTRNQRRALEAALAEADETRAAIQKQVERWQAGRGYTIVGRLMPSSVYDGKRLPLMYRVQSVEPLAGSRTLGYIRPGEASDLKTMLGQVVGIRGKSEMDHALGLRIFRPEVVEAMHGQS